MRIRRDDETPHLAVRFKRVLEVIFGLLIISLSVIVTWVGAMGAFVVAMDTLGLSTPWSAAAGIVAALGITNASSLVRRKLLKFLDEKIVGRTRVTYIRTTQADHPDRLTAISANDDAVDEIMKSTKDRGKGSTIESRTNNVVTTPRGYRAITYVTLLIEGIPLKNSELLRDGSPIRCVENTSNTDQCETYTTNISGVCDHHSQFHRHNVT